MPPEKQHLTHKEQQTTGELYLKTHEQTNLEATTHQPEIYECSTCGKKYTTQRNCNRHRAQGIKRRQQWENGKQEQYKCTSPQCAKNFTTSERQLNRIHQHAMQHTHNPLYTLGPEGRISRGRMMYRNAPTQEITQANDTIKYNPQQNEWECLKCGRKENTQNKRNLIQHVIAKRKTQKTAHNQEHMLVQIRIQILRKEEPKQTTVNEITPNLEHNISAKSKQDHKMEKKKKQNDTLRKNRNGKRTYGIQTGYAK